MYIPYQNIVEKLNLNDNDILLVASDISKLAYTSIKNKERFNSDLFIESFENHLSNGLLIFPAFNSNLPDNKIFNINECLPEMGTLSVTAFKRSNYYRNCDPLHSFLFHGKEAEKLANQPIHSTFGLNSIFDYLNKKNAKMLLIDIDLQHSFTFAHHVEQLSNVRYRKDKKVDFTFVKNDSSEIKKSINVSIKKKGYINTLNRLENDFVKENILQSFEINDSKFQLIHLNEAFNFIKKEIESNKGAKIHQFDLKLYIKMLIKSIVKG